MKITDVPVGAMWKHGGSSTWVYVKLDQDSLLIKELAQSRSDVSFSFGLKSFHVVQTDHDADDIVLVTEA